MQTYICTYTRVYVYIYFVVRTFNHARAPTHHSLYQYTANPECLPYTAAYFQRAPITNWLIAQNRYIFFVCLLCTGGSCTQSKPASCISSSFELVETFCDCDYPGCSIKCETNILVLAPGEFIQPNKFKTRPRYMCGGRYILGIPRAPC